jgi:hypothetical protein
MKMALLLVVLCLPCWGTFSLVQSKANSTSATCGNGSTTSCTTGTITATGSGHLLTAMIYLHAIADDVSAVSGGGTWAEATSCPVGDTTDTQIISCWYVLSSSSGATSVTATVTTGLARAIVFAEYSFTGASVSLDYNNGAFRSTSSTSQTGITFTLTGSNDVLVQGAFTGGNISAISGSYSGNLIQPALLTVGFAYVLNSVVTTAPTWTTVSGRSTVAAMAFSEASSSTSQIHHKVTGGQ